MNRIKDLLEGISEVLYPKLLEFTKKLNRFVTKTVKRK